MNIAQDHILQYSSIYHHVCYKKDAFWFETKKKKKEKVKNHLEKKLLNLLRDWIFFTEENVNRPFFDW